LFRARLLQINSDDHLLVITMHHIISDGWSRGILMRELASLYEEAAGGRSVNLTPLPIQYSDFSAWQRQWMEGDEPRRQIEYGKEKRAGAPAMLDLPTDHPRPAMVSHRGLEPAFEFDRDLVAGLREFSREQQTTLFMTVLAGWFALLYRYSGQADI